MLTRWKKVAKDEDGAVTVDWVVLTAAVVGLAGVAYTAINGPTGSVSSGLEGKLTATTVSLD